MRRRGRAEGRSMRITRFLDKRLHAGARNLTGTRTRNLRDPRSSQLAGTTHNPLPFALCPLSLPSAFALELDDRPSRATQKEPVVLRHRPHGEPDDKTRRFRKWIGAASGKTAQAIFPNILGPPNPYGSSGALLLTRHPRVAHGR